MSLLLRNLSFPWVLALRYLRSTRRDAFATFLSVVAAVGLALGVAALILVLAVISGFQHALRGELLGRTPEIEVELPAGLDADSAAAARDRIRNVPGVVSAQLQVRGGGWLVSGGKVQPVELIGFEQVVPNSFPGAAGKGPGLYVPSSLAARWALQPGQTVEVVSPRPTLTPFGPQPRIRSVQIAGTYRSGRTQEERERVALPRQVAETLLGGSDRRIEAAAEDVEAAIPVAGRLSSMLPEGSVVRTWKDLNRPLLFALRLEKALMFVAVSLVVLVAALALVADLALIISNKQAEIGILGTIGATPAMLRRAFVLLGGLIAGSGMIAGTALGVGGAFVADKYKLVRVPGQVYFLDHVPFLVQPLDLALVLLLTFFLALGSSFYAAQRAASLDPIEAMQQ
ncbi:MAG TPA: FtsX-like permease family protein [Thermoanaerobaculia bacterium]|nr:FtsX-like permease family protein [Thermoanaerobaculia bacterium]